ncbi:MAG: 3-deoxy-D-manno-octulosonic acid kinase [Cellvibrionaceae bacterium]|nr:3-deoxy-D-manno-octulosonic acid kinase [Cellvibrionaceae bacterium]
MTQPSFIQTQQGSQHFLWNCQVLSAPDPALFAPPQDLLQLQQNTLGRGTVVMFRYADLELVRRHYQRGGLVRHLSRDIYIGSKLAHTRMWREFHLLRELYNLDLPVPQPVAARYTRIAPLLHRGDLVTRRIPTSRTLAEYLRDVSISEQLWRELGETLGRFHHLGVYHADLNANNILLDERGSFHLIDFDKGERRSPDSSWQQANLQRLLRSLHKLQGLHPVFHFSPAAWSTLQEGYLETAKKGAQTL